MTPRPRTGRPNSAPPYYLGRPASVWITATARHRQARLPAEPAALIPPRTRAQGPATPVPVPPAPAGAGQPVPLGQRDDN